MTTATAAASTVATTSPTTLLLALTAALAAAGLLLVLVRVPAAGVALLAGGQAWQVVARGQVPTLDLGLISLYPLDVLSACAAVATVVALLRRTTRPHLGYAALGALALLMLASLVTGARAYGLEPAGNDARGAFAYLLVAAAYTASAPPSPRLDTQVWRIWTLLASLYAAVAVVWWTRTGIGSSSDQVLVGGELVNARPDDAASALVVAQAAVALLCARRTGPGHRLLAAALLVVVLLLQHRTVWLAAFVMGAGWLLLRPGSGVRRTASLVAAGLTGLLGVTGALLLSGSELTQNLTTSATDEGTMQWRIAGWRLLLDRLDGTADWLFGLPFGSGYARFVDGGVVESQPHNYFLHLLLRAGLLGLVAAAVAIVAALRRTDRRTPTGLALWLTTAGVCVFCCTYAPTVEQGLLLGLLLRHGAVHAEARTQSAPPALVRTPLTPTTP
ncbi:hypothetical protein [Streptomyces sp. NPDC059009]|uniref:hypothetical protein n=1 Tax=Streptomyces sp. NPDC059009 TaxID=3346694 RepID=UPI0036768941